MRVQRQPGNSLRAAGPPAYIGVDFRLFLPPGGAHDYAEVEALFEQRPGALATLPGETVLRLEEADAPGWSFAYLKEGRVGESDVDVATASFVFVTESVDLTCSGHLSFPGVTSDWVRNELPSLRAYCGSVKKALWRP